MWGRSPSLRAPARVRTEVAAPSVCRRGSGASRPKLNGSCRAKFLLGARPSLFRWPEPFLYSVDKSTTLNRDRNLPFRGESSFGWQKPITLIVVGVFQAIVLGGRDPVLFDRPALALAGGSRPPPQNWCLSRPGILGTISRASL